MTENIYGIWPQLASTCFVKNGSTFFIMEDNVKYMSLPSIISFHGDGRLCLHGRIWCEALHILKHRPCETAAVHRRTVQSCSDACCKQTCARKWWEAIKVEVGRRLWKQNCLWHNIKKHQRLQSKSTEEKKRWMKEGCKFICALFIKYTGYLHFYV